MSLDFALRGALLAVEIALALPLALSSAAEHRGAAATDRRTRVATGSSRGDAADASSAHRHSRARARRGTVIGQLLASIAALDILHRAIRR